MIVQSCNTPTAKANHTCTNTRLKWEPYVATNLMYTYMTSDVVLGSETVVVGGSFCFLPSLDPHSSKLANDVKVEHTKLPPTR